MRHSTEYLYGIEPFEIADMPYKTALQFKYDCATELYNMLYLDEEHDTERMYAVLKARTHTRELIDELIGE